MGIALRDAAARNKRPSADDTARQRAPRDSCAPAAARNTPAPSPQDAFLAAHRGAAITVRLLDGKTVSGVLVAFDTYSLTLAPAGREAVLVYKHAAAYLTRREPQGHD